jgi:LmbE family N-acetylglucosaminyl deacetylase
MNQSIQKKLANQSADHAQMNFCILAIGAHADDIELQMGGTLAKYHAAGYSIGYVMATNNMSGGEWGVKDDSDSRPIHLRSQQLRKGEADAAAKFFSTTAIHLDHPQRHYMDSNGGKAVVHFGSRLPEGVDPSTPCILTAHEHKPSIDRVVRLILELNPEAVFTHGGPMRNIEHFATQHLVTSAYWDAVSQGFEGMLVNWHDLGVNSFAEAYKHWDTFVDISDFWGAKMQASAIHKTMKPDPTILDWPQWGPGCGCRHAEVFTIVGRNKRPTQYGALTLELLRNER